MAGCAVRDGPYARVGEALPAEEGEGEGWSVWGGGGWCCCWGWWFGEEVGREVGENGVEVERVGEAEVEFVGEEVLADAELVVAFSKIFEGCLWVC